MTEIWIVSRKQPVARCWGTVGQDRARHVVQALQRQGYRVRLRQASELVNA